LTSTANFLRSRQIEQIDPEICSLIRAHLALIAAAGRWLLRSCAFSSKAWSFRWRSGGGCATALRIDAPADVAKQLQIAVLSATYRNDARSRSSAG